MENDMALQKIKLKIGTVYQKEPNGIYYFRYQPELKPNRWVGIRIKWTMEDPDIWNQVHRIAGALWIIGGYLVILETVFLPLRWIGPVMLGIIFFTFCIFACTCMAACQKKV